MCHCPLCAAPGDLFYQDKRRDYLRCNACLLVWVPPAFHLSPAAEKAEYDKHENDPQDPGYQRFLSRTWAPLKARVTTTMRGLDFGCGEARALSQMAARDGYQMADYDLYYYPVKDRLKRQYDYIALTEVIEHIALPAALMEQLMSLLVPGGWLAVMTKRVRDRQAFAQWHYKNDPTHICFYSEPTFAWLAERWNLSLEVVDDDVVLFKRADY